MKISDGIYICETMWCAGIIERERLVRRRFVIMAREFNARVLLSSDGHCFFEFIFISSLLFFSVISYF